MLDTNTASYIIKGNVESVRERLKDAPAGSVCVSSITAAELLKGAAKLPKESKLPFLVENFLSRIEVLPWAFDEAKGYAEFRTLIESKGKSLGCMDMLIAAHSHSSGTVLVTNDQAFHKLTFALKVEDWAS
ncbi:type II toxin-antitoxin system VapC family toxin [Endozoicomonas lisbonensis]